MATRATHLKSEGCKQKNELLTQNATINFVVVVTLANTGNCLRVHYSRTLRKLIR